LAKKHEILEYPLKNKEKEGVERVVVFSKKVYLCPLKKIYNTLN